MLTQTRAVTIRDGLPESVNDLIGSRLIWHAVRCLSNLSFSPKLECFARVFNNCDLGPKIHQWQEKYDDADVSFYFATTKEDDSDSSDQSRSGVLLCRREPKTTVHCFDGATSAFTPINKPPSGNPPAVPRECAFVVPSGYAPNRIFVVSDRINMPSVTVA
ncbi:hypothetical protein PRK78_005691 [Emydomyces testavorans]|uniref:Uncharacterized protein n=1 Tax=Emydomyces testavorans TaxID=2070801 RepID=A0AAF0IKZ4_9EURO|nr:hypothetical protein PRK78_005691 [Emydomyces testavorans]